jgi:hypothetical protein
VCLTCTTTGIHMHDKYGPGAYVRSSPGVRLDMAVVFCCACSLGPVSFHILRTRVERGQAALKATGLKITFLSRSLNIINK